jgi:transcriptional regulator with XRE-family HTH domain
LTQNEMAGKLGLSLNRYREYEQNTTDNSKGISIELLLRIAELENFSPGAFLKSLTGEKPEPSSDHPTESSFQNMTKLLPTDKKLVAEFLLLPTSDRVEFATLALNDSSLNMSEEPLIPKRLKWLLRLGVLISKMDYADKLKIERELIEEYLKSEDLVNKEEFLDRLKDLVKFYYTNFDSYRK